MTGNPGSLQDRIVAEALEWVGTPYRHQASRKGVGCDCLGLLRGVWRAIYGHELEQPGPYAPDWAEASEQERLLDGLRRHFVEKPVGGAEAGDLIVFRWRPHLPAKHAAILTEPECFVHAYQDHGVDADAAGAAMAPAYRCGLCLSTTHPK